MSDAREALLYFELDKGGESAGPLFDEPRRRLENDPALRAGWQQFQALKALAWESAPEPGERLLRQALAECRRERVRQQLARSTGSEDLAREILLGHVKESRGLPVWAWALVLAGGLGAAWLLLGPQIQALLWPERSAELMSAGAVSAPAAGPEAPLAFEFPAQAAPAQAALAAPATEAADDSDVKKDGKASREARKLLREHLQSQAPPTPSTAAPEGAAPRSGQALESPVPKQRRPPPQKPAPVAPAVVAVKPKPSAIPTARPTLAPAAAATVRPTAKPTSVPTAVPTVVPTAAPTAVPTVAASGPAPAEASFSLSAPTVKPGGSLKVQLGLPERKEVDLRLFDQRGRPVAKLHSGDLGPGELSLPLPARDESGQALAPGTYYLRVMTAWFSRVEPVEVIAP
jgi:hypothetical protein